MARESTSHRNHGLPARRRSLRLPHFDYGESGSYFVTVCIADRKCLLGKIVGGRMELSPLGKVVEHCLLSIPAHFPNARLARYQVMPNHLHVIIEILRAVRPHGCVGVEYIQPLHSSVQSRRHGDTFQHIQSGSLPSIVRTFKAAVSREARRRHCASPVLWQRSYYDRIIRDDAEYYFVERYIALNPLIWHLDRNNPSGTARGPEEIRRALRVTCRVGEEEAERLLEMAVFG